MSERFRWSFWLCGLLALWLLSSPVTMAYANTAVGASELASASAILILSASRLSRRSQAATGAARWALAAIGLWLTVAPLVFWSAEAASYANGMLIGTLVMICAVIVPSVLSDRDPEREPGSGPVPAGWTYNPSSWKQRAPIIGLAFAGFLMARYLSAFQLGHIRSVWEPVFGKGSETILTSEVSRWFPVSDAGLGAWSYLVDAISGAIGGTRRWHRMPWVVILFGIMVIPPGVTSITLVILQPLAVGAWCTLCLATAAVMLAMVPPAIDEVVATMQALAGARRRGHSLWRSFWEGIPGPEVEPAPVPVRFAKGYALPGFLFAAAALGLWLMASPAVLGISGLASDTSHLLGALVVTVSVIAMAQVARPVRFLNCLIAIGLAASCAFLPGGSAGFRASSVAVAVGLFLFSLPLGPVRDRYGGYDRRIRWSPLRRRAGKAGVGREKNETREAA